MHEIITFNKDKVDKNRQELMNHSLSTIQETVPIQVNSVFDLVNRVY